ncbi:MAG: hypothetical protein H7246_17660, partial [Phycisphaerae bacterium]|nr:hypothetical protein [Saprospiraceae bacterium]
MKRVGGLVLFWFIVTLFLALPKSNGQSVFPGLPVLNPAYVNNFSEARGLPQTCASDAIIDHRGRIWVATCPVMAGINSVRLFQFDGYDFNSVNLANDSIPERTMAVLKQTTADGELLGWFESEGVNTMFLFNPDRQTTRVVSFDYQREGAIKDLAVEADGKVLVVLNNKDSLRLYRLDQKSLHKQLVTSWSSPIPPGAAPANSVYGTSLFVSGDEALVANTMPLQIFRINLQERHCQIYPVSDFFPDFIETSPENRLVNDQFSLRFFTTALGDLMCFVPGTKRQMFIRHSLGAPFEPMPGLPAGYLVIRVEKDAAENILLLLKDRQGQYAGLLYDRQGRVYDYSPLVAGHKRIYNLRSLNFLETIFISADDGLSYKSIQKENAVQCMLSGYSIRGMAEIEPGLFFITSENKPAVFCRMASGKIEAVLNTPLTQAFGLNMRRKFDRSSDGSIWGNRGDTLVQYNPVSGAHQDYAPFPNLWYKTLLADGRIAVFRQGKGLSFFDPVSGKDSPWNQGGELRDIKGFVHGISQTRDGKVWLLTTHGLWQIDLVSGKQKCLGFGPEFRDFRFLCMAEADDGKVWLGTFLGGIHIYDPATGTVKVVDKSNGLPNNTIASITRDAAGDFWAATYKGLARLSPEGVVMANLLQQEGLCELEFNRYAALLAQDGTLLLGTIAGLQVIHPQSLAAQRKAESAPQIYLTSLTVADAGSDAERTYKTAFNDLPRLVLPPDRRHLRVHFALSNYLQSNRNQFAYMLEGVDKNWTFIGSQNELVFNDLPSGRYTLLIKGCDFQGNWTAAPVRISLYAREFFYKQAWFYVLCALPFVVFALIWFRRLRSE